MLQRLGAKRVVADEFCDTEVDDLRFFNMHDIAVGTKRTRERSASIKRWRGRRAHQHIRRLEIAMQNALAMRVTNRAADQHTHAHAFFN